MALDDIPTAEDAYLTGADAGRAAAKSSIAVDDALEVDMYAWTAAIATDPDDDLRQSFRDGWMKAYRDTREKIRAADLARV